MTKIKNPFETGYCEKCQFSVKRENNDRKLFCKLSVVDILVDKPVNCKKFKTCFSYKAEEKRDNNG